MSEIYYCKVVRRATKGTWCYQKGTELTTFDNISVVADNEEVAKYKIEKAIKYLNKKAKRDNQDCQYEISSEIHEALFMSFETDEDYSTLKYYCEGA